MSCSSCQPRRLCCCGPDPSAFQIAGIRGRQYDLAQPPGFFTTYKLKRLEANPAACRILLADSDFRYTPIPDRVVGQDCAFRNAVQISRSKITYGGGFPASCSLVVALALFERHALQPASDAAFGESVVAVEHYGTFACRNVNNAEGRRRSQHAAANAIDIAGFRLRDGRRVTVRSDWGDDGAEDDSCGICTIAHAGYSALCSAQNTMRCTAIIFIWIWVASRSAANADAARFRCL